ncbi:RHS repeat-associated core domain-containing protein [Salmonella enterica]|nr:RHS repeat-associated core domain-containing protein [Salmonella enterica]
MHYNQFRYYDCDTGQYLCADPIGLTGGINNYSYVPNSLKYIDPLGLCKNEVYIPRDENGNPLPLNKQRVNGQDIPLPDPATEGRPHTVLGGKVSSLDGEVYRQSATFPGETWPSANGQQVPWSEVHWGNHGRGDHANPHQYIFEYDSSDGEWRRGPPTPYHP